jgi:hypothetical protein
MIRLLSLVILAALAAGASAQLNHPYNEVGIHTVPDPVGCETAQVAAAPFTTFTAYVVLTNPYNDDLGRPVTTVGGFEFSLQVPPSVFVLSAQYPPGCVGFPPPPPDFITGCDTPVSAGAAVLMTFVFMPTTVETVFFHLGPLQTMPPFFPGQMAFADDDFSVHVMHPVSGSADVPVFAVNWDGEMSFCATIPARDAAFGSVKALYR